MSEDVNKKVEKKEIKGVKNSKKLIIAIICFCILVGGINVYAATNGYGNVFFLIKYLITGENEVITEKSEILKDRDITISYEKIQITSNIEVQVRNLKIFDNNAKLILYVTEKQNEKDTKLKYKIFNSKESVLADQLSSKKENSTEYIEEIGLNNYSNNDNKLKLIIYINSNDIVATLLIDIDNKTIEIEKSEVFKQISEIELKEFLKYASSYIDKENNKPINDYSKVVLAIQMLKDKNMLTEKMINGNYVFKVDEINNILTASFGYDISEYNDPNKGFKQITQNNIKYFVDVIQEGECAALQCINISDISYQGEKYKVTYTYGFNYEVYNTFGDIYQNTITFTLNDDDAYSKYKMVSFEKPELIQKEEEQKQEENKIETNETNTAQINVVGKWNVIKATDFNNKDISLTEIFGTIAKYGVGTLTLKNDGTFNNYIGAVNDEFKDDWEGTYRIEGNQIFLNCKSGNRNVLTYNENNQTMECYYNNYILILNNKQENQEEKMSYIEYKTAGLKFLYPSTFKVEDAPKGPEGYAAGEVATIISGKVEGKKVKTVNEVVIETGETMASNLSIKIYTPFGVTSTAEYSNWAGYITPEGLKWSCSYNNNNYTVDGKYVSTYYNIIEIGQEEKHYAISRIDFEVDNKEEWGGNSEILNVVHDFLTTTKITSY